MTPNQQREEISKAYVAAVAARCGFKLGVWSQDDDCLDVTVGAAGVLGGLAGPKIDLQLKATSDQSRIREDHVALSLPRRHYDLLRADACNPRILVTLVLPADHGQWIEHTAESLIMRRCAYWQSLSGWDPIDTDADSTTVRLPLSSVFSPTTLAELMARASRREPL